jgi:outer membrane protein assembly factor BamA
MPNSGGEWQLSELIFSLHTLVFFAFYDTGKLWEDGSDSSTGWLSGYGGGVWIAPLSRIVLNVSYTVSKEDKLPIVSLGWKF